jgi:hypothetical protein
MPARKFSGLFRYYPGRSYLPAPLRAFIDLASTLRPWPAYLGSKTLLMT